MGRRFCVHQTKLTPRRFAVVAASSMSAACLSSALLGSFMCALVLLCHKYGLDPGEQTLCGSSLDTNIDFAPVCDTRQHRSSSCVLFRRPRHTLSSYGGIIPLHQPSSRTFHPCNNYCRNIRRRNRLGRPRQQKPACKTSPSRRLVASFRGHDHKQRYRSCLRYVCWPVHGLRFARGG